MILNQNADHLPLQHFPALLRLRPTLALFRLLSSRCVLALCRLQPQLLLQRRGNIFHRVVRELQKFWDGRG